MLKITLMFLLLNSVSALGAPLNIKAQKVHGEISGGNGQLVAQFFSIDPAGFKIELKDLDSKVETNHKATKIIHIDTTYTLPESFGLFTPESYYQISHGEAKLSATELVLNVEKAIIFKTGFENFLARCHHNLTANNPFTIDLALICTEGESTVTSKTIDFKDAQVFEEVLGIFNKLIDPVLKIDNRKFELNSETDVILTPNLKVKGNVYVQNKDLIIDIKSATLGVLPVKSFVKKLIISIAPNYIVEKDGLIFIRLA